MGLEVDIRLIVDHHLLDVFWDSVFGKVSARTDITPATLHSDMIDIVLDTILRDEHRVLSEIESSLCVIDAEIHCDATIKRCIGPLRVAMGDWRSYLHPRAKLTAQLRSLLPNSGYGANRVDFEVDPVRGPQRIPTLESLHNSLLSRNERVLAHCEATFTALMATMSMIESEIAIKEAEGVTRLTKLAFFIPITLAAGIFGMNIRVGIRSFLFSRAILTVAYRNSAILRQVYGCLF